MDINANMPPLPNKWCIKGSDKLSRLISENSNLRGNNEQYYYFNDDKNISKCLISRKWRFRPVIPKDYIEIDVELLEYHINNFIAEEIKANSNSILSILTKLRIE